MKTTLKAIVIGLSLVLYLGMLTSCDRPADTIEKYGYLCDSSGGVSGVLPNRGHGVFIVCKDRTVRYL